MPILKSSTSKVHNNMKMFIYSSRIILLQTIICTRQAKRMSRQTRRIRRTENGGTAGRGATSFALQLTKHSNLA